MNETRAPGAPRTKSLTAVCSLLPLVVYLSTAARTVQGGDAGEFGLIGMLGGVAHPPGYPLYSLLARIAGFLPIQPPFLRIAAVSAVCGAATVAVIQRAAWRFSGSVVGSVLAALVFAFAPLPWRMSGIPEVFTLNTLAAAVILLLALEGARPALLGLACGLGLTNHLTIIWCVPIAAWALFRAPRAELPRRSGLFFLGALVGLLPYLLLPIWAHTASSEAFVWGQPGTWHGFLDHVLRRDYGTFRLAPIGDHALLHLAPVSSFFEALPGQFAWLPFALGLTGLFLARRTPGAVAILASFGLAGVFFISLFNLNLPRHVSLAIEERFHLLPMLLLVPFVAVGAGWLLERAATGVQAALVVATTIALLFVHHDAADWKRETVIEDYARAAVRNLAPDAVLLGSADTWFSATRWVTRVARERSDVHYVDINLAHIPWYASELERNIHQFPRFAVDKLPWKLALFLASTGHPTYILSWDNLDRTEIAVQPHGLVDLIVKPGTPPRPLSEEEADLARDTAMLGAFRGPAVDVHSELVRRQAALRWQELAERYQKAGDATAEARCRQHVAVLYPQ